MKRNIIPVLILAALIGFFSVFSAASGGSDYLSDHFSVWCDDPDAAGPLSVALIYANEGGVLADGILHFMPLKDFLEYKYDVPVVTVKDDPVYHVKYDSDFFDDFRVSVHYYQPTEDSFVGISRDDGEPVTTENLEPGDYLMAIDIHADRGREYYAGAAFIHIIIPGGERSVWPIQTETPYYTPEPPAAPAP